MKLNKKEKIPKDIVVRLSDLNKRVLIITFNGNSCNNNDI